MRHGEELDGRVGVRDPQTAQTNKLFSGFMAYLHRLRPSFDQRCT